MRSLLLFALLALVLVPLGACGDNTRVAPDAPAATPDTPPMIAPTNLQGIYDEVDGSHLIQLLKDMSGANPVVVNGQTITIDQRYDDAGRQRFRDYWTQTMTKLGLTVTKLDYQADGHPRPGVDLEAVLPGASPDSIVVIVHYDSIGPPGQETQNPGADDDMTGMAILLETARLFVEHRAQLAYTVRFVASDEEELGGLAGARYYAAHIKAAAQAGGFKLIAAVDDEQTGWNCNTDGACPPGTTWPAFDIFSCSGPADNNLYDNPELGDAFAAIVATYSPLHVVRDCLPENSDHYAMWEVGVKSVVYSEHDPFANDHFDQSGGDLFSKIDTAYFTAIARAGITFQASLAGIPK